MSKFAHLWLGAVENGPVPTYRDDSPEGVRTSAGELVAWPENAVMAIEYAARRFPTYAMARAQLGVRFFGEDGWPLDFPVARKRSLADRVRLDFQVSPMDWRDLLRAEWVRLEADPDYLARDRFEANLVMGLLTHLPGAET